MVRRKTARPAAQSRQRRFPPARCAEIRTPISYRRGCIFSYSGAAEVCRATVRPGPRVRGALARRLWRNPAYFLSTTPEFAPV